jgi:hypothetical protein
LRDRSGENQARQSEEKRLRFAQGRGDERWRDLLWMEREKPAPHKLLSLVLLDVWLG